MRILTTLAVLAAVAFGCATAEIGDECETSGSKDECVDGAICSPVAGANTCRKICTDQAQCAATESCLGVAGSNEKSCQPESTKK